jgi:hypothetical protein
MSQKKNVTRAKVAATFRVGWADGTVDVVVHIDSENWNHLCAGEDVHIVGDGYWYEGEEFLDTWFFKGGIDGELTVSFEKEGEIYSQGDGWIGNARDALLSGPTQGKIIRNKKREKLSEKPTTKKTFLIVVPHWPGGTMAMKFGSALKTALEVQAENEFSLIQSAPERIFRVTSGVGERKLRSRLRRADMAGIELHYFEIGRR